MDKADIPFLPASELAGLIEKRDVSPVEAAEAYLERIDRVDGKLNSYITVSADHALESAKAAETEIAGGGYRGPMHGIPYAVKDQFNTRGILTTGGSSILKDFVPQDDATVIANLGRAGGILLGKLNMSEFAMGTAVAHPYGVPHNPWDLARNPGTSSSGSGAATAAFLCATSLGEDTGGSIRGPGAFSGVVGLRPSFGRVSRHGMLGAVWSMDIGGPISRTVEDCAITLGAIAGYDPNDRYTWDAPVPDYLASLEGSVAGMKVGVVRERIDDDQVDEQIKAAVLKAVSTFGELGASVEEVSIPLAPHCSVIFNGIAYTEGASVHRRHIRERLKEYDHNIQIRNLTGSILPAQAYYKAQKLRQVVRRQVLEALEKVDVLLLPTSPILAPPIRTCAGVESKEHLMTELMGRNSWTTPFNLAGVPAISVPCGFSTTDPVLPIGLQIAGRPFDEATVMKAAHAYQQGTDWHNRRPPI